MASNSGEKNASPPSNVNHPTDFPRKHGHDDHVQLVCPAHTTERRLVALIDWHIMPWLCIIFLLAFLDRINISNANVLGLSHDLGLTGNEYNIALVGPFPNTLLRSSSANRVRSFSSSRTSLSRSPATSC